MSEQSTGGLFAAALASAKESGQSVGEPQSVESTTSSEEETLPNQDLLSMDLSSEISPGSGESGEEQEQAADSELSEDNESEDSPGPETSEENVEYIKVKDAQGRKRKVKVDYSDKDNIKRAFSMAAGARKWQAERDSAIKELSAFKESAGKKVENWDSISNVYEQQGIQGLVNFLEGSDDAFEKLVDQTVQEREWRSSASPEELELYQVRQQQAQKDSEVEKLRKELEEIRNSQMSAREEAELSTLKAEINPVFDKYRFAGKLGNPAHEEMLDEMLWNNAMKQLESVPDEAEVSSVLVNKVFRNYANNLRTLVKKEADKKVTKTIAKKKRQATEVAQVKASKQLENPGKVTASDLIRDGRIGDLFKIAASRNKNFIK